MPVQDILYAVADQALAFDAPEGRPSAVTSVEVFRWDSGDEDEPELATTGVGAVEANPNTTTDAAAGASQADPRRVPLTSTAGAAAARMYLLAGADSLREWIEVREVESGDAVYANHPLHNDYASGATFQSTRMSIAIDPTWVADDSNIDPTTGPNPMFRVRWVYVVAGVTYVADSYFNLVRYAGRHGVTPQSVDTARHGWLNELPADHRRDQGRRLIDDAFRDVKLDLHTLEVDDSAIAESDVLDELVRLRTIANSEYTRFLAGQSDDAARYELATGRYTTRLNAFVRLTMKTPLRDTEGAASTTTRKLGLSRR